MEVSVGKEGIFPKKPVYDPGELLDFIKGNENQITSYDLKKYFNGNDLLAMCASADFDVSGLLEPTNEFKTYPDKPNVAYAVYKLTKLGEEVDYAHLRPRMSVNTFKLPATTDLTNKILEGGIDPEEALKNLSPEEREKLKKEIRQFQFPTYNEQ